MTMVIFYDRSLRLWTGYWTDAQGNQIGNAEYAATKLLLIKYLEENKQ
jgi:hypothetical protein